MPKAPQNINNEVDLFVNKIEKQLGKPIEKIKIWREKQIPGFKGNKDNLKFTITN